MSIYTYSVSTDTANGIANLDKLASEINASLILISLLRLGLSGDELSVEFKADLSAEDKTLLAAIVGGHQASPVLPEAKIIEIKVQEVVSGTVHVFRVG